MGIFRFLLALSVIIVHSGPILGFKLIPGHIAVESFFMISGFYMAMILDEKYFKTVNYYKLFITNRLLRIYPIYWVILLITIMISLLSGFLTGRFGNLQVYIDYGTLLKPLTWLYFIATNIAIIGQEFIFVLIVDSSGSLQYTNDPYSFNFLTERYLLDMPSWTISLEICFYLICPYFVKLKTNILSICIAVLLLLRLLAKLYDIPYSPFVYRFLPFQIVFFLAGILSYKLYRSFKERTLEKHKVFIYCCLSYILLFSIFYSNIEDSEIKEFIYLVSVFLIIPILFAVTNCNKIDRFVGELSYPMYISHSLVVVLIRNVSLHFNLNSQYNSLLVFLITVIFSIILVKTIGDKLERLRAKRIKVHIKN